MNKPIEKDIKNAVGEKPDPRAKHLLALKAVIAQLLKLLFPAMFEEMSLDEIASTCMNDNPDSPYLMLLNEEERQIDDNKYINDLVFKLKLPEPIKIDNLEFSEILVNIEPQNKRPSDYPLEIRALIYACEDFLTENKYLKLEKAKEMYRNAIPLLSIWILLDPSNKFSNITAWQFRKIGNFLLENQNLFENSSKNSMITIIIIEVGKDLDYEEQNIFTYLDVLLREDDHNKVLEMFESYGIQFEGGPEMFLTALEQSFLDKGINLGETKGKKEGETETLEKILEIQESHPELTTKEIVQLIKQESN